MRLPVIAQFLLCVPLVAHAADSAPVARALVPLEGARREAALVAISANGDLRFDSGEDKLRMRPGELVAWGAPAELRSHAQLVLADGGAIAIRKNPSPATDQNQIVAVSDTFGEIKLPLAELAGLMLHAPIDAQRRDALAARLRRATHAAGDGEPRRNADRLFLENGDELAGRMIALTETAVEFETEIGPLTVEVERVAALAFNPSLRSPSAAGEPRCLVGLADGSVLTAKNLSLQDGHVQISLPGLTRPLAADAELVYLQPLAGAVRYLSDLAPAGYRHLAYLSMPYGYQLDANVAGTRLRAGGGLYAKGVGMHSTARLTWQLEKPYRRFEADLAIDDATGGRGSVAFRVFSGPREIFKSPIVRGGDAPLAVSVEIGDVRQLSLVVDYADRADVLDHANWLNPRLVP